MIKNWLVTGDIHGKINRLDFLNGYEPDSTAIILLGDVGFNYSEDEYDLNRKRRANHFKNYIYCIRGNHEKRPEDIPNMEIIFDENVQNDVFYESDFPYIRYLKDGLIYKFGNYSALVLGGAYSVDKNYRIATNQKWFENEQLSPKEMEDILESVTNKSVDFVMSHTCPYTWRPTDLFLKYDIKEDNNMEKWMDSLRYQIDWNIWLFGHFHQDRYIRPHVEMLFNSVKNLDDIYKSWNNKLINVDPNYFK